MTDDERRKEGLLLAQRSGFKTTPDGWYVPSRTTPHFRFVRKMLKGGMECSCLDFETTGKPCAHIYAVLAYQHRQTPNPANPVAPRKRPTYGQDWPAYNDYQVRERELLPVLLNELIHEVVGEQRDEPCRGRPRIPLRDSLLCAALKVGSDRSARRSMPELGQVFDQGIIRRLPSYNSILKTIADESLTPVIETLVAESSRPLKEIETDFAVDSTGFGVGQYYRHYSVKRKALSRREEFLKLHACVGIQTHIFAAVRVTDGHVHDMKEFQPLVNAKAEMFTISEISADKGYLARKSFDLVDSIGAAPYIAFKRTSMPNPKSPVWDRLFHLYSLNRQEFLTHYHKRSNVESAFSALKRRFADFIRAKKYPAQKNELLLKILIYNVGCVIQSMFELGIDPSFSGLPRDSVLSKKGAAWKVI